MKISSVRIENFRSFDDQTLSVDDYSCFVGPNGAGKSTVLSALNVFFQNSTSTTPHARELEEEDFHNKRTDMPIRITVTFTGLSEQEKGALGDYVRQDRLIVTAEANWSVETRSAPVKQHGQRLAMREFVDGYFSRKSEGARVTELQSLYTKLREGFPDLPLAKTGGAMEEALRAYEADHPDQCEEVQSNDEFYGANSGKLNAFVQWVYVPAVKDAQEEGEESKKSALGQLLARTVRATTNFGEEIAQLKEETLAKFEDLVEGNQGALQTVSDNLKARLAEWSHADANLDLRWICDRAKSVQMVEPAAGVFAGEGEFSGRLSRMGHGLQRSYLLALLTELANVGADNAPTLILSCEEPELYQHPPQARRLADVFKALTEANTQVLVTTHSPYFVSGKDFADVRLIRKDKSGSSALAHCSTEELNTYLNEHTHFKERPSSRGMRVKINQSLQPHLNEMFFCRYPVFVEGLEDVAFITTALHLYGYWEDFHASGCHLIAANGKRHLIHPVAIANKLQVPYFLVFDCDGDCKPEHRSKNEPDNLTLLSLVGGATSEAFPVDGYESDCCRGWSENMGNAVEADFGEEDLQGFKDRAQVHCGQARDLGKNSMFIAEWLTLAHEKGLESKTLRALCDTILASARKGMA